MTPAVAELVATKAHAGQKYGERPYIDHVKDVVSRVMRDGNSTIDTVVVAWLHDVVEDTLVTFDVLISRYELNGRQLRALQALTRQPTLTYGKYIRRVCRNPIATLVKFHDLRSNLAADPPPALRERYEAALPYVTDSLLGVVRCRSKACDHPIVFLNTRGGKLMPVNRESLPAVFDRRDLVFDANLGHESHYATCQAADRFRSKP